MPGSVIDTTREILRSARDAFFIRPSAVFAVGTVAELSLDPAAVRQVSGVQRLADLGPRQIAEVTAAQLGDQRWLAENSRRALESRYRLWVVAIDEHAATGELVDRFGDALSALGPVSADGRRPYGITPADAARQVLREAPELAGAFEAVDSSRIPPDLLVQLEELEISFFHRSALSQLFHTPSFWVYALVFVYSALRVVPVIFVEQFYGSLLILWLIDIVTAIPYTWGVIAMVTGNTRATRLAGTLVTIVTFVAPYVYFWYFGRHYPRFVVIVIASLIVISFSLELVKYLHERGLERRYRASRPALLAARP